MRRFPWWYWIILDLLFIFGLVYSTYVSWRSPPKMTPVESQRIRSVEERTLGMTAVSGAVGSTITAASIILSVTGAIVALGADKLPPGSKHHFLLVAVFSGFSLIVGVFSTAALPQLAWRENVAFSQFPAVLLALQIYPMVPAFVRLCLGIYRVIRDVAT